MRIFMTGIAGGLGTYLTNVFLEWGYDVRGNDIRSPEDAANNGLRGATLLWKATESLEPGDIEGCDIVINLSATGDRPMGLSSPNFTMYNNSVPTVRILELCKSAGLEKFIQLGSGTSYLGIDETELPATEATMPKPTNPYSASKYAQDILCMSYYHAWDLPVVIVRSGITYGAGRLATAPHRFLLAAMSDRPIVVRGGRQTRTPTHVSDIAQYVLKTLQADNRIVAGKVINAVYPTDTSINGEFSVLEMAALAKQVTGSRSEICIIEYDRGELIRNRPVREWIISTMASKIGVVPQLDLASGFERTAQWLGRGNRLAQSAVAGRLVMHEVARV